MSFELECPIDFKKVNGNKVRLTALWVLIIVIGFILTQLWLLVAVLIVDFALRAFGYGQYSFLHKLSDTIIAIFKIQGKPIEQAPKVFAAQIGFGMAAFILILFLSGYAKSALTLAGILAFFAFLESVFSFCAGCYIYTFYQNISPF